MPRSAITQILAVLTSTALLAGCASTDTPQSVTASPGTTVVSPLVPVTTAATPPKGTPGCQEPHDTVTAQPVAQSSKGRADTQGTRDLWRQSTTDKILDPKQPLNPPPGERIKTWDYSPCWDIYGGTWHRSERDWGTGPYARLTLDRDGNVWVELFGWVRPEVKYYNVQAYLDFSRTKDEPRLIHTEWQDSTMGCDNTDFPSPWGGRRRLKERLEPVVFDSIQWAHLHISVNGGRGGSC